MIKYLIALLLVTATVQQETFLSPPIPPTAFYQQYYQVIFRVRGLNGPTFTFENLPNFFVGTAEGVVSGTPNITGTFRVGVSYTDGTTSGSSRVVISVTASANTDASAQQSAEVTALVIQNALNSWIYRAGDDVSIQLACSGTGSITWDYKGLPKGLSGDSNGKITGKIADSGLYSFSASAGDSEGRTTQAYYTLNIQPGTVIKTNTVLPVPDRSVPVVYSLEQVAAQQAAAGTAVITALKGVAEAKGVAQGLQAVRAKAQASLDFAFSQANAAEVTFGKAQGVYSQSLNTLHIAQANLNTAKNIVDIATTALKNANAVLADAKSNLAQAQSAFNVAKKAFDAATAAYTIAKNELSQAQADYNSALATFKDAQNAYNIAWANVQAAKVVLDDANNKLEQANADVVNAKNAVGLATQANDDAQTGLNFADVALTVAQKALEKANAEISSIRGQFDESKNALGSAKFNYNQALNNLYVAQAAKEASDKALAIAVAQGASSMNIFSGESTYVFEGCLSQVYPSIAGSSSVVKLIPNGAQLSSGQVLTWGECTTKDTINIGDVITYSGSITGNCISGHSIVKVA